jgi:hypothetical protein
MPVWIYNGLILWLALVTGSFTLPIWQWSIAPGRWRSVRQFIDGTALVAAWSLLVVGAEMLLGLAK